MIFNLVLLSVVGVMSCVAEPPVPASRSAPAPRAPSAPVLAYASAPLVFSRPQAQAAPAASAPLIVSYATNTGSSQQYVSRTFNGITTLALEPAQPEPARLVVAATTPFGGAVAAPEPAPVRVIAFGQESAPEPSPVRVVAFGQESAPQYVYTVAAPAAEPVPAPAKVFAAPRVFAVPAPQVAVAAPASSSSQFFSRNYNGVPTVTYFVVGPAPIAAAPGPAPGPAPRQRPTPGATPAGEPVNTADVEVLDA